MISRHSSLIDVAYEVCTALDARGVGAVLVGGSAATFYTDRYRSHDADFVITSGAAGVKIEPIVEALGFRREGSQFVHSASAYTLDFPAGPLGIGRDIITHWETAHRGDQVLYLLSRTDSVCDRLAAFYHWDDRNSLRVALFVATSGPIDLEKIRKWSVGEGAAKKFGEFLDRLTDLG